jgi:hypothetical protein
MFMDFAHLSVFFLTQRFGNWMCFHLQVKGRWPLLYWLTLSKGPNKVGFTFFLHEDGNIQFPKRCVLRKNIGRLTKSINMILSRTFLWLRNFVCKYEVMERPCVKEVRVEIFPHASTRSPQKLTGRASRKINLL